MSRRSQAAFRPDPCGRAATAQATSTQVARPTCALWRGARGAVGAVLRYQLGRAMTVWLGGPVWPVWRGGRLDVVYANAGIGSAKQWTHELDEKPRPKLRPKPARWRPRR